MLPVAITKYFTRSRLKRLRELHEQFPIWSGHCEGVRFPPEFLFVTADAMKRTAVVEFIEERALWRDSNWHPPKSEWDEWLVVSDEQPTISSVVMPTLLDFPDNPGTPHPLPTICEAVLAERSMHRHRGVGAVTARDDGHSIQSTGHQWSMVLSSVCRSTMSRP
jgi:hypothetical protein